MKVEMIDLEEFFNDKYKFTNNTGIGATGIITQNQMVTRFNETKTDRFTGNAVRGLGPHDEEVIAIIRDIFAFNDILDNGLGYYDADIVKDDLDENYQKMINETIQINYVNCEGGNIVSIHLPKTQQSLTTNQLDMIKYLGKEIEKTATSVDDNIVIYATDGKNFVQEENTIKSVIIPYLSSYVNDSYKQSIDDVNILGIEKSINTNKI